MFQVYSTFFTPRASKTLRTLRNAAMKSALLPKPALCEDLPSGSWLKVKNVTPGRDLRVSAQRVRLL